MKLTRFGSAEHRLLSDAVAAALGEVEKQFGVKFRAEGGRIGTAGGRIFLDVNLLDTGTGLSSAQIAFNQLCAYYGLKPEDFGKTVLYGKKLYKITGLRPTGQKYTVEAEELGNGKTVYLVAAHVVKALEATKKAA